MLISTVLHFASNLHKYEVICVDMDQDWVDDLHRRIAAAIKHARGARSAQWLADETERLGFPISRAAIANYESGRKKGLDVAELLTLAAAMQIPPLALIFPDLPDGPVELLPNVTTTSWDAAAWFSGEAPSPLSDDETPSPTREYSLLRAVRERRAQLASIAQFHQWLNDIVARNKGALKSDDPDMRAFKQQLEKLRDEVASLESTIRENGGVLDD